MSRKDDNPSVVGARWAKSMKGGKILGPQAERNPSDMAHQKARDDANNAGADAWSPSRAREALRAYVAANYDNLGPRPCYFLSMAEENAYASIDNFSEFCRYRFGRPGYLILSTQ